MFRVLCFVVPWTARAAALVVAGLFTLLVVGEFVHPHSGPPTHLREWVGIVLLTSAIAGMLLAWRWELGGALLSLAALASFVEAVHMHRISVVAVLAAPSALFLGDWVLRHWQSSRLTDA